MKRYSTVYLYLFRVCNGREYLECQVIPFVSSFVRYDCQTILDTYDSVWEKREEGFLWTLFHGFRPLIHLKLDRTQYYCTSYESHLRFEC